MKKLLLSIFILCSLISYAQYPPSGVKQQLKNGVGIGTKDRSLFNANDSLILTIDSQGKLLWRGNGSNATWKVALDSASGGAGITSIATNNGTGINGGTITTIGTLSIDTLNLSTRLFRIKGTDSLAGLIALRVKISDTANMLSAYQRILANYSTTYALSNDVKDSIQARLAIRDTASMLSNYLKQVDLAPYKLYSDTLFTTGYTTRATTKKVIDSVAALILPLTGYVPYTGAISNVNLGEYGLSQVGFSQFDLTPTYPTMAAGKTVWNTSDGTLDLGLAGGNVTLQLGQELLTRVVNKTGIDLTEAAYSAVYLSGAQGQRMKVDLALANNSVNSSATLGLVTENIPNNLEGFITTNGLVREINTTGSLQGETWVDGQTIYLSAVTAGALTNVMPVAPNHKIVVGYVVYAHAIHGSIYVKVSVGQSVEQLNDVEAVTAANNEVLAFNSSTSVWQHKTIPTILGYTPLNKADSLSGGYTTWLLTKKKVDSLGSVKVGGTGVSGKVAYWNGTNTLTSTSTFSFDGTTVGVPALSSNSDIQSGGLLTTLNEIGTGNRIAYLTSGGTIKRGTIDPADLVTTTTLASYVPYSGATANVVLGNNNLLSSGVLLNQTSGTGAIVSGYTSIRPQSGTGIYGLFLDNGNTGVNQQLLFNNATSYAYTFPSVSGTLTTGTGTAGQVAYWNGTSTQTGSSSLAWDNTNSRLTAGKLDVLGDVRLGSTGQTTFTTNSSFYVATTGNIYLQGTGGTFITGNATASGFVKSGGTSSQFLMADGSVNTSVLPSGAYLPLSGGTLTGALGGTSVSLSADGEILKLKKATVGAVNYLAFYNSDNTRKGYIGSFTGNNFSIDSDNQILNLTSGTAVTNITGALSGTSATFTGSGTFGGGSGSTLSSGSVDVGKDIGLAATQGIVVNNARVLYFASTGAATFSNEVVATRFGGTSSSTNYLNGALEHLNGTLSYWYNSGSTVYHSMQNNAGALEFKYNGGSPYLSISTAGAATFSNEVTITNTNSNKLILTGGTTQNGLTFGAGTANGFYLFNGTYSADIGWGIYNTSSGTMPLFIFNSGEAKFTNTVTASAFYESSDIRQKTVHETSLSNDGINAIQYTFKPSGADKWGYSAQQVQAILPYAVTESSDGFLKLDYTTVHTYKIAQLEKRIAQLEKLLNK